MSQLTSSESDQLDALIAAQIEPHPSKPGQDEWRVKERGVPVWALIGGLLLTANPIEHPEVLGEARVRAALGQAQLVARVAREYGISDEAMAAAIAYYRRHRRAIDARLIMNAA